MSSGITVDRFVTELRHKSKDCEFGRSEDDMLRDKLVFTINDPRLKKRLLRENGLTLQKPIDICRSAEQAKTQIQAMQSTPVAYNVPVDTVKSIQGYKRTTKRFSKSKKPVLEKCLKCGKQHEPHQCPAYGAVFHKCGKNNHFSNCLLAQWTVMKKEQ